MDVSSHIYPTLALLVVVVGIFGETWAWVKTRRVKATSHYFIIDPLTRRVKATCHYFIIDPLNV